MKTRTIFGSVLTFLTIAAAGFQTGCSSISVEEKQSAIPVQNNEKQSRINSSGAPIYLNANEMSIATGNPSLVNMSKDSMQVPVWSLSGETTGQSVAGLISGLPNWCTAVKVEIVVTTTDKTTSPDFKDVYRVHLSQMLENAPFTSLYSMGTPVQTSLPKAPFYTRTIVLESCYPVEPNAALWIRIQREPGDPADTFIHPTGLTMVKVTPLPSLSKPYVVQNKKGYNSWPMIQAIGKKLVCVYSRGSGHSIGEDARAVYARTSTDNGKTWTPETIVANTPKYGEVEIGKGLDSNGAMLLWVRRIGKEWNHDLYRSTDGVKFTLVTTPKLDPVPMQITDIFALPNVGLMALWFAGNYRDNGPTHSWGILTSNDNGATWKQTTVESKLPKAQWPTEPSAVYLGDGVIFVVARVEGFSKTTARSQFQIFSTDYGKTWKRTQTNISDVFCSTPSLIFDKKTGLLSNYYYHRGKGVIRRRVVAPKKVIENPLNWPDSEAVAMGSKAPFDSGNVNTTVINGKHYLTYYSGKAPDTAIFVSAVPAPTAGKQKK